MVLKIDLLVRAGFVDGNAILYMEVISSDEGNTVLKVLLELILLVVLVLYKFAMDVAI